MQWLKNLSGRQKVWLVVTLVVAGLMVTFGALRQGESTEATTVAFTTEMSLKDIAHPLGVTGKALARDLGLPLDAPKNKSLKALGVSQEKLDDVVHHAEGHSESNLKYYIFTALVLVGLIYLVRLGRPDGSPTAERKTWYPRWPYIVALVSAVAVCGFALGKSPNPMEGAVKVFKSFVGLYPSVADKFVAFGFFVLLVVIGNKLICGWACPFGALQELIYHLPILKKLKRRKVPFVVSNTIRIALFVVMVLLIFGIVGGRKGLVLYHYVNPFNLFNLDMELVSVGVAVLVMLVVSFGFYRPFCQFICPFGLLGWFFERLSLFRVKIDHNRCTKCNACVHACPLDAAKGRVAGKAFPADCFSCARCLKVCPEDAIHYGLVGKVPKDSSKERASSAPPSAVRTD